MNTYVHVISSTKMHLLQPTAYAVHIGTCCTHWYTSTTDNHQQQIIATTQQPHHSFYAVKISTSSQRRHSDTSIRHLLQFVFFFNTMGTQKLAPRRSTGEIYDLYNFILFKRRSEGNVSVISSNPPYRDDNATTIAATAGMVDCYVFVIPTP